MNNNSLFLDLPSDWKDETIYTFTGPVVSGILHNLIITVEPNLSKKQSIEEFADRQRVSLTAELPGYEELAFEPKTIRPTLTGMELIYRFRPSDDMCIYQKQFFMIMKGNGYICSSSYSKKTFKTVGPIVDNILSTFTLFEEQ